MKQLQIVLQAIAAGFLSMSLMGCVSHFEEQKTLAYSAGFKVITPIKPDQVALLPTLPKDQVTPIDYHGKRYYILPDAENHRAFVGGQIEFTAYQRLCMAEKINAKIQSDQMRQAAVYNHMNWGAWGGWGTAGSYHGPVRHARVR
jgi:hypothetical protein